MQSSSLGLAFQDLRGFPKIRGIFKGGYKGSIGVI